MSLKSLKKSFSFYIYVLTAFVTEISWKRFEAKKNKNKEAYGTDH